jgi:hypothetical protein
VVAASRAFVCVRLLTYENAAEAEVLKSLFLGREGTLENTVFALLAPDGATRLSRVGRTPKMVYGGDGAAEIAAMAEALRRAAAAHPGTDAPRGLPVIEDLRRALNVAACDGQPLVVLRGGDGATEATLARLAWSDAYVGRCVYVRAAADAPLAHVTGAAEGPGVLVVQPGAYGLDGAVVAQRALPADQAALTATLREGCARFRAAPKDERRHIAEGRRQGVDWKPVIPDTDPGPPAGRRPR